MMIEKRKEMENHGSCIIWFWGSRRSYWRNVYESSDCKLWVVWYGTLIEVKKSSSSWCEFITVQGY